MTRFFTSSRSLSSFRKPAEDIPVSPGPILQDCNHRKLDLYPEVVEGVITFNQHFYYDYYYYYLINPVSQFSDFNFTSEKRHSLFSPLFLFFSLSSRSSTGFQFPAKSALLCCTVFLCLFFQSILSKKHRK